MPQCFVINDWLLHDLMGENGISKQQEAFDFLSRLIQGADCIAVLHGSSWMHKTFQLMTFSDPLRRQISKYLQQNIILNSEKCRIIQQAEVQELPSEVTEIVPVDDHYLFVCYYAANANLLVTSDVKLYDKVVQSENLGVEIILRDVFLADYLRA